MRSLTYLTAASAAALMLAAPATAATAPSRAVVLSGPGSSREVTAAAGGGRTLVAWTRFDHGPIHVEARLGRRGHGFGPTQHVGSRLSGLPLAGMGPGGTAALVWTQAHKPSGLVVAVARPGHRFGRPHRLDGRGSPAGVAVDARGRVVVAWQHGNAARYAVGSATRRFHRHTLVSTPFAGAPMVDLARVGRSTIVIGWTAPAPGNAVQGRVATVGARSGALGSATPVGSPHAPGTPTALAGGPAGAIAAGQVPAAGETAFAVALRGADGSWTAPESAGSEPHTSDAYSVLGPFPARPAGGVPAVVWQSVQYRGSAENPIPDHGAVRLVTRGAGGWSAPLTLSRPGSLPGTPALVAVRDRTLVAWPQPAPGGGRIRVAEIDPSGAVAARFDLPGRHVRGIPALADAGDRALVAWVGRQRVRAAEIR